MRALGISLNPMDFCEILAKINAGARVPPLQDRRFQPRWMCLVPLLRLCDQVEGLSGCPVQFGRSINAIAVNS